MWRQIQQEPVLFQGLIQAALALFVALGLHLSANLVAAILGFTAALLSFVTRSFVTPIANPRTNAGIPLTPQVPQAGN